MAAKASVMLHDDVGKKWVPAGTAATPGGLSKVQIYQHMQNNTFRVVGRRLQDPSHEVTGASHQAFRLRVAELIHRFRRSLEAAFICRALISPQKLRHSRHSRG